MTARASALRFAILVIVAGCGGAPPATGPPATSPPAVAPDSMAAPADACRSAYADYAQRWRAARTDDLMDIDRDMDDDVVESIVSQEIRTLPARDELAKLRTIYAIMELLVPSSPWPLAFAAADRAIDHCGERARQPT